MSYRAQARFVLSNSKEVIAQVCTHLLEHDAEIEDIDDGKIVRFQGSSAHISCREIETKIDVTAPTVEGLYFMRLTLASHIRELTTDDDLDILLNGDGYELGQPPNFRVLDVVAAKDITPHMRRLTLAGDVQRYDPLAALHVNLILPHPEVQGPQWPQVGTDGLIVWPNPDKRPFRRKYTVRSVNMAAGTIDIDFVLHDDAGPGSQFARQAKPGDQVGMIGPGGGGLVEAGWYLFAGDETALPAIARMLEHLPAEAQGKAIIEVASDAEMQPIHTALPFH